MRSPREVEHLVLLGLALVQAVGCATPEHGSEPKQADDPPALMAEDVRSATDFSVRVEDFDWEAQTTRLIELSADGQLRLGELRLVGLRDGVRRDEAWQLPVEVDEDAVESARAIVAEPAFLELRKSYSVPGLEDGVLVTLEVTASGERQRVRCHNRVPEPAQGLLALMNELAASRAPSE